MIDVSDLIGIRYKEHGRSKDGYDCYGLVLEIERRLGNEMPDFRYDSYSGKFITDCFNEVNESGHIKEIHDFVEGTLILFKDSRGFKDHIGVYLSNGYFIHCDKGGVRLDLIGTYKSRIGGLYVWQK